MKSVFHRRTEWVPQSRLIALGVPLAVMLFATSATFEFIQEAEHQTLQSRFDRHAENSAARLRQRLAAYQSAVASVASFFTATENATRIQFADFARHCLRDYREIQALEWVPRVAHTNRAFYEQQAIEEGHAAFSFRQWQTNSHWIAHPEAWAGEYFPVYFVEPIAGNESVLGIDLASNPERLAALARARDTGRSVGTEPVTLVQASGDETGFLLFVPVFKSGLREDSVESRREHLVGFALGVFRMRTAIASALSAPSQRMARLTITDVTPDTPQRQLYEDPTSDPAEERAPASTLSPWKATLVMAGRRWQFVFTPTRQYVAANRGIGGWLFLGMALVATGTVVGFVGLLTQRASGIRRLVQQRTFELEQSRRDATQRMEEAQAAKRASDLVHSQFSQVVENSPTGIFLVNADKAITFANAEASRIFHCPREKFLGDTLLRFIPRFEDHTAADSSSDPDESTTSATLRSSIQLAGTRADGSPVPLEVCASRVGTADGYFLLVSVLDITERKKAELAQRKINDELEGRVNLRTRELHAVNLSLQKEVAERQTTEEKLRAHSIALENSNRDLEAFAYAASHDLQEPLRKIRTYSDLLGAEAAGKLNQEEHETLVTIQSAAGRMSDLIDDLLVFSRVDHQETHLVTTDLDQIVADVLTDLELTTRESRARIETDPLPRVVGDPVQLRQHFQNLIANALKFHPPDRPPHVEIRVLELASGNPPFHHIAVRDHGIGFDPRQTDRIFEPFKRLHGRTSAYTGTGMGLAICRRIVERHGGTISASGTPGQGAVFTFTLPADSGPIGNPEIHDEE